VLLGAAWRVASLLRASKTGRSLPTAGITCGWQQQRERANAPRNDTSKGHGFMGMRELKLDGFAAHFIKHLLGAVTELEELPSGPDAADRLIAGAREGDKPDGDDAECKCLRCSLSRGVMPPPPTGTKEVEETIVRAMDAVRQTAKRSSSAGAEESREFVKNPLTSEVEALLIQHRVERYNASARTMRMLNELLPPSARLPERMIAPEMVVNEAIETVAKARQLLQDRLDVRLEAELREAKAKTVETVQPTP
jgi:hypothetical protein